MTDVYHELLEMLSGTTSRIQSLLEGDGDLPKPPTGEWGPAEILAHMVDAEKVYRGRMQAILSQKSPPYLRTWDPQKTAAEGNYAEREVRPELEEFAKERAETISLLMNLALKDWERIGIHDQFGELSVEDITERLIDHDTEHLTQLQGVTGS